MDKPLNLTTNPALLEVDQRNQAIYRDIHNTGLGNGLYVEEELPPEEILARRHKRQEYARELRMLVNMTEEKLRVPLRLFRECGYTAATGQVIYDDPYRNWLYSHLDSIEDLRISEAFLLESYVSLQQQDFLLSLARREGPLQRTAQHFVEVQKAIDTYYMSLICDVPNTASFATLDALHQKVSDGRRAVREAVQACKPTEVPKEDGLIAPRSEALAGLLLHRRAGELETRVDLLRVRTMIQLEDEAMA